MSYSYEEVQEIWRRKAKEAIVRRRPQLENLEREAIPAEKLTQNDDWRIFLQIVEGNIERHRGRIKQVEDALANPEVVDYETILKGKVFLSKLRGYLEALEQMSQIPKLIEERAVDASHQLELIRDLEA